MQKVLNCPMKYICTKDWFLLESTSNKNIKYCDSCNREVHFCNSNEELESALQNNLCIGYWHEDSGELKKSKRFVLGIPNDYRGFDSIFKDDNEAN